MNRNLTDYQHDRLDRVAEQFPAARVVGWHPKGGPVLRHKGRLRYLSPGGRLVAIKRIPQEVA